MQKSQYRDSQNTSGSKVTSSTSLFTTFHDKYECTLLTAVKINCTPMKKLSYIYFCILEMVHKMTRTLQSEGPPNIKNTDHPQDNTAFCCRIWKIVQSDSTLSDWNGRNNAQVWLQ